MTNIRNMTTAEIDAIIFENAGTNEFRSMPMWIAEQVIEMDHIKDRLKDWAWETIAAEIDD